MCECGHMNDIKILGICDDHTTCELCGKQDLKCTVALEINGAEPVYYGRDCAGMVVLGKKSASNTRSIERAARSIDSHRIAAAKREAWNNTPEGKAAKARSDELEAGFNGYLATHPTATFLDWRNSLQAA